jgi:putative membrane protein
LKSKGFIDWILRLLKGMLMGTGAILPGVSGGALAAVFGLYERMISFLAHLTHEFKKNLLFFLPVGIGGVSGIFLLSFALSYFMENYEVQIIWFFIGAIIGILPALIKQAGKRGRTRKHLVITAVTFVVMMVGLVLMDRYLNGSVPLNFFTWMMAGAIAGLGMIVPGLSPSNFLVYLNMYKPMTDGIKNLDLAVIIPIAIGGLLIVLLLSKLFDYIFAKAYAGMYHFILGVVFASTVMIVPGNFNYLSLGTLVCVATCALGVALGLWMSRLEERYKPEN